MHVAERVNHLNVLEARNASSGSCAGPCGFPYCPLRDVTPGAVAFDSTVPAVRLPGREAIPFSKICQDAACAPGRMMVIGTTCCGKTTLSRALAKLLDRPHVEFDALFWDANWQYAPDRVVGQRLKEATARSSWILDGNCLEFKDIVWRETDTLIWLDYSLPIVFWRAFKRTVGRCLTREVLWGKNVESWRRSFLTSDSTLAWAWKSWHVHHHDYDRMLSGPDARHLNIHRFRSTKETTDWLCGLCFNHNMEKKNL